MEPITQETVDCWRANYGLDARSPADAARYWSDTCAGMAPAGAVAALGLLLKERDALRKDSELLEWMLANPETAAEELEDAGYGTGDARSNLESRKAGMLGAA